jgi:hypothetical protein
VATPSQRHGSPALRLPTLLAERTRRLPSTSWIKAESVVAGGCLTRFGGTRWEVRKDRSSSSKVAGERPKDRWVGGRTGDTARYRGQLGDTTLWPMHCSRLLISDAVAQIECCFVTTSFGSLCAKCSAQLSSQHICHSTRLPACNHTLDPSAPCPTHTCFPFFAHVLSVARPRAGHVRIAHTRGARSVRPL